jgi:uncharacterized protein (DUF362 family)
MLETPQISICQNFDSKGYPEIPPYHADVSYPEYPFKNQKYVDSTNTVYHTVRESLSLLGLDYENTNSPSWNPLKKIVKPDDSVVIKPNAVWDININKSESAFASITHGSVMRVIIDYVYIALDGRGKIIIADAPLMHSDFENWKKITGVQSIIDLYQKEYNFNIEVIDLRKVIAPWDHKRNYSPAHLRYEPEGDPLGYCEIDLGRLSEFSSFSEKDVQLLYGSDYDRDVTIKNHSDQHHRYSVSKTILASNVVISIPKLKVHSKVGVTLNIKGMVGTQGDKNYIPHHRIGSPSQGGDEYPDSGIMQTLLNRYRMWLINNLLARKKNIFDKIFIPFNSIHRYSQLLLDKLKMTNKNKKNRCHILGGSWFGNDTTWRMALDLTRIILYCDSQCKISETPKRKFFSVVDGIIAGEGEGPLSPTAKYCGVIIAGFNPIYVDASATRLIGFDPKKIKMISEGNQRIWMNVLDIPFDKIQINSNIPEYQSLFKDTKNTYLKFRPPCGWIDHIEITEQKSKFK